MIESDQQESAVEAVESEAFAEAVESDVDKARRFLAEAERQLAASYGRNFPSVALATAAGVVGAGYAQLAVLGVAVERPEPIRLTQPAAPLPPELEAALRRGIQAFEEQRPEGGEPVQPTLDEVPPADAPAPKPAARARRPKGAGRG
ncbi:hypothetical protein VA596_41500 [Amycolatopsis sp., V23-08]|uniref:DUF3618 domain-containing protein n=1 Tax=Amycolatopsis heterodermiae TaxID=3110235 RepID=A0ABU5RIE8_9PSEU|nr:hypothetical protein [Amycolatopsis sp., V23-08]MEA5366062.1 hypothetical protein [Amycolatopsis sp., V23-08]